MRVEAPLLLPRTGGASAHPFHVHSAAADYELAMSFEPQLVGLIGTGLGAVHELGRVFRDEPADAWHNPEFTLLEAAQVGRAAVAARVSAGACWWVAVHIGSRRRRAATAALTTLRFDSPEGNAAIAALSGIRPHYASMLARHRCRPTPPRTA